MSGFGAFDFSSIRSSFGPPPSAVPVPPALVASAVAGTTKRQQTLQWHDAEASVPLAAASTIAMSIQHSDVSSLVSGLQSVSESQLRSLSGFSVELASTGLRASEHRFPYHTPTRLTREVVTQLHQWQARVASHDAAPASSSSAASASACPSDFHVWLGDYKSTLPVRLTAASCVARAVAGEIRLILDCIPSFGWIDFAEQTMQAESLLFHLLRDRTNSRLIEATVKRIEQLAALERERIPDPSAQAPDPADPLSTAAVIAALITAATRRRPMAPFWVCMPVLRALLSAATAPALIGSDPARIPLLFHELCTLEDDQVVELGALLLEFGILEDSTGRSLTLHVILSSPHLTRRWLAPANAHISMPLGWLGARHMIAGGFSFHSSHPHLQRNARCDVWDALCRLSHSPQKLIVQHAIDWHYATVTPKLREALSAHLIHDLHAEVMSFLMPPSSLPDPPIPPVPSAALVGVRSWLSCLSPEQTADARRLRSLEHALCVEQINAGFVQRAFEAERQQWMVGSALH